MQKYKNIKNPRSTLGMHSYKTQGSPLVSTCSKPKAPPWIAYSLRTMKTTFKSPSSTKRTTTRLFGKTFNRVQITLTPHKHHRRSFAKRREAPPYEWQDLKSGWNQTWDDFTYLFTSHKTTKALLPKSPRSASYAVKDSTLTTMAYSHYHKYRALHRQRQHT